MLGTVLPTYHRGSEVLPMNHSVFEAMQMPEVEVPMLELMPVGNSHMSNSEHLLVGHVEMLASWVVVFGELDRAFHSRVEANCKRSTKMKMGLDGTKKTMGPHLGAENGG